MAVVKIDSCLLRRLRLRSFRRKSSSGSTGETHSHELIEPDTTDGASRRTSDSSYPNSYRNGSLAPAEPERRASDASNFEAAQLGLPLPTQRSRQSSRDRRSDPKGLTVLVEPPIHRSADIIFIHGLGGSSYRTWSQNHDPDLFWPKLWLPSEPELKSSRIMTYGYDAHFSSTTSQAVTNITDFAKALLYDLKFGRDEAGRDLGLGEVPIIFVVHSMGGLVFKRAYMLGQNNPDFCDIVKKVEAVLFLSTPHRGTNLAIILNRILSVSFAGHTQKQYISDLSKNSAALEDLNENFRHVALKLKVFSFYETLETTIALKAVLVLDKDSSILGYPGEISRPLDADHHGVCKFYTSQDPNYRSIISALKSIVPQNSDEENPATHNKIATNESGMIELLMAAERAQEDFTEIQSRWQAGTCEALLATSAFHQWSQSTSSSAILWAHARPGSGKSVHASYLITHLEGTGCICAYYFFKFTDSTKRSTKSLLSCIAFQMAQQLPEYRENLVTLYRSGLRLDKMDSRMAWSKFILGALSGITRTAPVYWVIDALDESDSPKTVIDLLSSISELQIPIRLFVTSRVLPALKNTLLQISSSPLLELSLDDNTSDIQSCAESELQPMIGDPTFKQKIATEVVLRAQGNFLWAHLVVQQLLRCHSAEGVEEALSSLPPGMDAVYGRMEQTIASLDRAADQQLSRMILTWTVFARRPLTKDELLTILEPQFSRPLNFEHTISEICGHFVLINATNKVTLIHHSAREYLIKAENIPFLLRPANAHQLLFERSIGVFMDMSVRSRIRRSNMPEVGKYAATSWPYHLNSTSGTSDSVLDILVEFFQDNQASLTWIQSLAVLKQLKVLVYASRYLTTFITKRRKFDARKMPLLHRISDLSLLERWAIDLLKIAGKFGFHLLEDPGAIHRIVPAFCPNHSMIRKTVEPHNTMVTIAGTSNMEWDDRVARVLVDINERALTLLCRGRHLAVSTSAGTILVWDALTFNLVFKIDHDQHIFKMCFSNNGDRLAAYGLARTGIWQTTNGQQLQIVENVPEIRPLCMDFTAEDDRIIIASDTRKILELVVDPHQPSVGWDIRQSSIMEDTSSISGAFTNSPTAVAFSPDMTELAVAYRGFPLTVWSVDSPQPISRCRRYTGVDTRSQKVWTGVNRICWHPTNGDVLGIYTDGIVFKWNPIEETHDELQAADINATPSEIDCSPEGTIFATSDVNGSIRLYNVQHFVLVYQLTSEDIVTALCFSPDGRRFYDLRGSYCDAWEPNVLLRLSDTDERAPDAETETGSTVVSGSASEAFADAPAALTELIVDRDGATIYMGNEEGSVEVLDYNGESRQIVCSADAQMCVDGLACADSGSCFAYTNLEGELILQRLQETEESKISQTKLYRAVSKGELKSGLGSVRQLLFNHNSTTLLLVTQEFVQLWTTEEGLALKKSMRTDIKAEPKWVAHPFQIDQLLCIDSKTICAHSWSSLEVLHQWSLTYPTIKDQEDHGRPHVSRASSSRNTLTTVVQTSQTVEQVVISYNKRYMVFSLPGPEPSNSKMFFFDTQALDTGAEAHSQTVELKSPHPAISSQILRCLAVLEPDKLVFLNKSYWICTWHLRDLERRSTEAVVKHYFLPTDWVSKEGLEMCRMASDGTLFWPRNGRVAVLRSSVAAEW